MTNVEAAIGKPSVLVVDDEESLLRAHARALTDHGYDVQSACDGAEAIRALGQRRFDVILSDIDMPGMNGIALLERVRGIDLDVPVVMITGRPSLDTAVQAMEHGALRYLTKPVMLDDLCKVADDAVRLHRLARAKRDALALAGGVERFVGDHAGLVASFERTLTSLHMHFQPIISWSKKSVFAYEALLRSGEPSLPHPEAVLDAAARLGRVHELGRIVRAKAIEPLAALPADVSIFINLDPSDLADEELFAPTGAFAESAERIVLEITERASLHGLHDVPSRVTRLRELGFRIAIDDLGAGYAGLTSFALLEPDIVKLDMALVRDIHLMPTKATLVRTMITMCKELNIVLTAEGVERAAERDVLVDLGCDLLQGYYFAKPARELAAPVI